MHRISGDKLWLVVHIATAQDLTAVSAECLASAATNRRRAAKKRSTSCVAPATSCLHCLTQLHLHTCITRLNTHRRLAHHLQMQCATREWHIHVCIYREIKKRMRLAKIPSRIFFEINFARGTFDNARKYFFRYLYFVFFIHFIFYKS